MSRSFDRLRSLVLVGICLALQFTLHAQQLTHNRPDMAYCAPKFQDEQVVVADFTVRTYRSDSNPACLQIFRNGRKIYREVDDKAEAFHIGQPSQPEFKIPAIPNGTDITGSGHPELIVTTWSGGAHCCFTWYLYQLQPRIHRLATISLNSADLSHIIRDPADDKYYFKSADGTFDYWHACFACSPSIPIILRWVTGTDGKGAFQIALDKMKQPPPASAE